MSAKKKSSTTETDSIMFSSTDDNNEVWDDSSLIKAYDQAINNYISSSSQSSSPTPSAHPFPPIAPPTLPANFPMDDELADLLLSWYYSGYYTGVFQERKRLREKESQRPKFIRKTRIRIIGYFLFFASHTAASLCCLALLAQPHTTKERKLILRDPFYSQRDITMGSLVLPDNFQHIIRIYNTNVDGRRKTMYALTCVKGIGRRFAGLVCKKADVDMSKRAGELSKDEVERLTTILNHPRQYNIPTWFLNRQKDIKDGKFSQALANQLDVKYREDIERLKKIRAHRGIRHHMGLRVRGQKTKTTGRRGRTVGVSKKKGG
eukprot:gene8964-10512_t